MMLSGWPKVILLESVCIIFQLGGVVVSTSPSTKRVPCSNPTEAGRPVTNIASAGDVHTLLLACRVTPQLVKCTAVRTTEWLRK